MFCKEEGATERQWRAAELSRRLQDEKYRLGIVLEKYAWLREKIPLEHVDVDESAEILTNSVQRTNESSMTSTTIPMPRKGKKYKFLRMSLEGSRWQRAKRPQLKWMTNQIFKLVQSHPSFGSRPLNILDIGGGRGHLANYLASRLVGNVANVHVIDIDSRTVRNDMMEAEQKSLNIWYKVGDASRLSNTQTNFDIVIALHACGGLSDVALAHAAINKAALVITPCCFRSNPHLRMIMQKIKEDGHIQQDLVPSSAWLDMDEAELDTIKLATEL